MVNWIAGHTERFKALVSHDGVFDLVSGNLETEELWFPAWEFGGLPWDPGSTYQKWNPMLSADKFKTPTLVITSERDYRVPFGQGLQFFTALQIRGVPSKLLTFPDEGHWVLKPGNSRLWHADVMDWLHRYLGGAEADPKALETAYSVTRSQVPGLRLAACRRAGSSRCVRRSRRRSWRSGGSSASSPPRGTACGRRGCSGGCRGSAGRRIRTSAASWR